LQLGPVERRRSRRLGRSQCDGLVVSRRFLLGFCQPRGQRRLPLVNVGLAADHQSDDTRYDGTEEYATEEHGTDIDTREEPAEETADREASHVAAITSGGRKAQLVCGTPATLGSMVSHGRQADPMPGNRSGVPAGGSLKGRGA